jgi:hypothetical protein
MRFFDFGGIQTEGQAGFEPRSPEKSGRRAREAQQQAANNPSGITKNILRKQDFFI